MLILRRRRHHLLNVAATRFFDRPISPPMVVHASSSSSSSGDESATAKTEAAANDQDHQKYWTPPPGMARVPWYRRKRHLQHWPAEEKKWERHGDTWDGHRDEHMVTADKTADGARLNDYYKVQQIVNWLPTIKEKIDFVNPYERDWSRAERRWHGRWMQPLLMPRKAWAIPPTPAYFDPLNFYKFVTKCRVLGGQEARQALDDYYAGLSFPSAKLEKRVAETLAFHLEESAKIRDSSNAESLAENVVDSDEEAQRRAKFLRSLVEDAHLVLAHGNQKLLNHRISYNPRCESFWTRAGFASLYQSQPIWETKEEEEAKAKEEDAPPPMPPKNKPRLAGDDRRRLGEFSFTMRDKFACQVRTTSPMKNLFNWTPDSPDNRLFEPLFTASDFDGSDEDKFTVLSPGNYNLHLDRDILWQCPGYEYDSGETHQYGRLAVKDIGPIFERMTEYWRPDSPQEREEMLDQCVKAAAIASLFNWLNGQAHCLGHTQYTELAAPLTSQLILSDGQQNFWFAVAQLNTLAINIEVEGFNNRRTNCCYVDGPYRLYESWERGKDGNAQFQHKSSASLSDLSGVPQNWAAKRGLRPGLNPALLQRLLQACVV